MAYTLADQIDLVSAIPGLVAKAAPRVATEVEDYLIGTIAAGTEPDGTPWKLTKKGKVPLRRAAKQLSVDAVGEKIYVKLGWPAVIHSTGEARGNIQRRVIPGQDLPPALRRIVNDALATEMEIQIAKAARNG